MLLLGSIISIAQPVTQRGTASVTVQDARLFAELNFRPPAFPDTIRANQQIGLDSCGALIYSRDINAYYYRACSPKRWVRVSPGGSASDSAYFSYRPLTDSTFLLCRVGGTKCDTIKVNGKGVSTAWLIGGNVNPIPPYIGTIDTKEVDIITNNTVRMRVAGNGINRSSAARNKFLTMDTTTRYLYYTDGGGGGTTPSLQDVATVGNYYVNDNSDTLRLNSIDGNIKHPILWTNDQYGSQPNNILDFNYNTDELYGNVAKIKFGDASGVLSSGYIEITDKQSVFQNDYSTRTIIQNIPSSGNVSQITYFPRMKGGVDTLATTDDINPGTITSISQGYGIINFPNPITTSGTINVDTTTGGLSGKYLRITDTTNKWVNNISRTLGKDSIIYYIGSTRYAIKDSVGGSSQNGRFGNDTATVVMAKVHNDAGVILTNGKVVTLSTSATSSNEPAVKLANNKADSTSANTLGFVSGTIAINDTGWVILSGKIEKLNTSAFSNGDVIYLDSTSGNWTKSKPKAPYHMVYLGVVTKANAGNGSIFVKCQNGYELDEIHDVQITSPTNNQILVYSDTQKVWKNRSIYSVVDTTNKIATKTDLALKVNISDTASMLSKYLRKTDTASLSSRINLKLNISDTASMLNSYLRKTDTTNKFVNSITRTAGKDSIIFYIGSTRYAIKDSVGGGGSSYTFSTGLTNTSGTVTNNLSTGVAGGQSIVGGTAASNALTLSSTTNATKGKILFGTSAYDEVNNRLGIGTTSPAYLLNIYSGATQRSWIDNNGQQAWYFSNGTSEIGEIAYGTPSNFPGIITGTYSGGSYLNNRFDLINRGTSFRLGYDASNGGLGNLSIFNTGNVVISTSGTTDAGYKLDVNGTARANQFQLSALNTAPATSTSTGTTGEIRIVNGFIYVCVATNTWQRATLSTF